jgi:hypothetical protein
MQRLQLPSELLHRFTGGGAGELPGLPLARKDIAIPGRLDDSQ